MSLITRRFVWVSDKGQHKPQKLATGLKFRIEDEEGLHYICSENKGADQLLGYRAADLRLWFHICKTSFSNNVAQIGLDSTWFGCLMGAITFALILQKFRLRLYTLARIKVVHLRSVLVLHLRLYIHSFSLASC